MKKRTYISLFSSAGIGCFGLKEAGFQCVATSELIKSRIDVQKANNKCKYESGYICGDITKDEIKNKVFDEVEFWKTQEGVNDIDVVIATPPCQGMSTANYKKKDESRRNSLVVEAIKITKAINPKVFIFENVKAFLKTICTDIDGNNVAIREAIERNLSKTYNIYYKIVNFKDYGVPSSRPRTLVIGTRKDLHFMSPLNLFPLKQSEITLRDAIGDLEPLKNPRDHGKNDCFHSFRYYDPYMREWIKDLKEGESAFSNSIDKQPYKIVDGKKQILRSGHMGNKFRRLYWNKPCACVATRNDQLASNDTIHPRDDRVLSIRELMRVMTIPSNFKWFDYSMFSTDEELAEEISNQELNIRRCIGEAVPTYIIKQISDNINTMLDFNDYTVDHIEQGTDNYYISSFKQEKKASLQESKMTGSFYTPQSVVFDSLKHIDEKKKNIRILEPSVGGGNFIVPIINVFDDAESLSIDVIDVDETAIKETKKRIDKLNYDRDRIKVNYYVTDFMDFEFADSYDYIIGNPPFFKADKTLKRKYLKNVDGKCDNVFGFFLLKMYKHANNIIMILPKLFLHGPEFNDIREKYKNYSIPYIYDYGVDAFKEVFVEIISVYFTNKETNKTIVVNDKLDYYEELPPGYIYHDKCWLIYRNAFFDKYISELDLDVFDFFRDRAITKAKMHDEGKYWIVKSKNVLDDGTVIHIPGYDKYIDHIDKYPVKVYLNSKAIIMPSFTYNTRAAILPDDSIANGSIAILTIKGNKYTKSDIDLSLYASKEFREYYAIVKNRSRFTINIDSNSIYYIGVMKK